MNTNIVYEIVYENRTNKPIRINCYQGGDMIAPYELKYKGRSLYTIVDLFSAVDWRERWIDEIMSFSSGPLESILEHITEFAISNIEQTYDTYSTNVVINCDDNKEETK